MEEYKKIAAQRHRARLAAAAAVSNHTRMQTRQSTRRAPITSASSSARSRGSATRHHSASSSASASQMATTLSSSSLRGSQGRRSDRHLDHTPIRMASSSSSSSRAASSASSERRDLGLIDADTDADELMRGLLSQVDRLLRRSEQLPNFAAFVMEEYVSGDDDDDEDYEDDDEERPGATAAEIQMLPIGKMAALSTPINCSVCLEDIGAGADIMTLPCAHVYHRDCVSKWLQMKKECPKCKCNITALASASVVSAGAGPVDGPAVPVVVPAPSAVPTAAN